MPDRQQQFGICESFRLNFELCIEAYDQELSQHLAALVVANAGQRLDLAELQCPQFILRMRDAAARLLLPYL